MSTQNESWWFYWNLIPLIANLIIIAFYYYYCIYSYKDPPRLYTSPTTEPFEHEKTNKEDKKTEIRSQQTKIAHQLAV